jgi:hypothetical protein
VTIHVSPQTEARLTEEARRQGLSVDALIDRLVNEGAGGTPLPTGPASPTVFEQGLGIFGSAEDTALIDEVVTLAYVERRRPAKEQPLAL